MLTAKEIDAVVGRAFEGESVEVLDYRQGKYSKEKIGFLGDHQNLEVTVKRKGKPETRRFFVKAEPQVSEEQSKFIREQSIFSHEAAFFNTIIPLLQEDFVGEDWCPKCFLANDRMVVLEDLRTRGFAMREDKIFVGDYLKSALKTQARMHASSVLAEARLGKTFPEICPDGCTENVFTEKIIEVGLLDLFVSLAKEIAQRLELDDRRLKTGLRRGFDRMYNREGKGKLSPVLCHGDTWPNNCMFDSNQPVDCLLVDFQLVRYGPRTYDVAQLLYLSCTYDVRRREERAAVEAYHKELCRILEINNPALERPSLEDVLEELESLRLSAMLAALFYYPVILISKERLSKYDDNQDELYKLIMFRRDNDYVLEMFDNDPIFAARISGLVQELVDYCEQHDIPVEEKNGIHK